MERTELIRTIHDLKQSQIANKQKHLDAVSKLEGIREKLLKEEKQLWEEQEEKHRNRVAQIKENSKISIEVEKTLYRDRQNKIEDQICDIKCEYFKDHPLERFD